MKAKVVFFMFLLLALTFSVSAQVNKAKYNVDDSTIGLQGYSPVSYLDLGIAQRGVQAYKTTYDGVNYYFTSAEQKAKFDRDPSKYLPQYGGFCAFGIYAGAKFRVDPNKFLVRDGKLYLFLYDLEVDAQQLWLQEDEKKLVKKANVNWQNLQRKA